MDIGLLTWIFVSFVEICLLYLCYDPNYNYDDDNDEDMDGMDEDLDEEG